MRARVQRNLSRAGISIDEVSDLTAWINQKIREDICADHYWSFMEAIEEINTVSGTADYSWPDATLHKDCRWIGIQTEANGRFRELDEDDEVALVFDRCGTDDGTPTSWARRGDGFLIHPTPDSDDYVLQLKLWNYPAALVLDADTNALLTNWSQLVEYGVTVRGLNQYGEDEKAAFWLQLYRDELGKAISVDRRAQAAANRTLGISYAAGRRADKRRRTRLRF